MRLLEEAGLPAGVANLVLGAGAEAGCAARRGPAGRPGLLHRRAGRPAGASWPRPPRTVKKVALELGGKNPNIVFADADLEAALDYALTAVFLHSGQVCSAGARLLVEESIHDEFVDELVERAGRIRLGGPFDDEGRDRPADLRRAPRQGRGVRRRAASPRARCCGAAARVPTTRRWPTASTTCRPSSTAARSDMSVRQDESFGPVLTVETFTDEDDAVRIANDSIYGLAGAVWTQDAGKAQRVARRLRMGTVWINDYHPYVPQAEWGGYKQSGIGRELGQAGLEEYRETKHVWHNIRPAASAGSGLRSGRRRWAQDRYDFVIVGGGSAGCALANRLCADPRHERAGARGRPLRLRRSTRSSTCRRRCRSRSATGSTTGSTSPSPSRTWAAAGSTTPAARCSAARAASTG